MNLIRRALTLATVAAAAGSAAVAMSESAVTAAPAPGAVYVLGNQPGGNAVLVFDRAADGSLSAPHAVPTGGNGTGGGLGSQGALIVDDAGRHLYVVNAGSDSISSFRITPGGLELVGVEPSNGDLPNSLTVREDTLYVLNAGSGSISGFDVQDGHLAPIAGSTQATSAGASAAQVSFTPDGTQLIVAERATQQFGVYPVDAAGAAGPAHFVPASGAVPFGFDFDNKGHVIVSEAAGVPGGSAVSSYDVNPGDLDVVSASVPTTEGAACWIAVTNNGKFAYSGNAATNSVTGFRVAADGALSILDADGKTGEALVGVTDLAVSRNSQFLYGRLGGNGTIGVWSIASDGSLTDLGAVPGLPAGAAGIAAS